MPGHLEHIELPAEKILSLPLAQNPVDLHRRAPERKPLAHKKISLADHRDSLGMAKDGAGVARADCRRIGHVVPVSMGQDQEPHGLAGEGLVGSFGRVEKDQTLRRLGRKAVGLIGSAGEIFELHRFRRVEGKGLIFLAQSVFQGNQL
jgi:hypothetical protein